MTKEQIVPGANLIVPKPKHVKGPIYALYVEKTMGIGQLPWDINSVGTNSE